MEGDEIMIKLKDLLTEVKFKVTLSKRDKEFSSEEFTSKNDAQKHIKQMVKKHKLSRQRGFWGNPQSGIELTVNF